jgi:hypothetical protein
MNGLFGGDDTVPGVLGAEEDPGSLGQSMALLARNRRYALPPSVMKGSYLTQLSPLQEMAFQQWVQKNNVPFDPSPTADYDMRGYYRALMAGDPRAQSGVNANDGQLHFTDAFKTPYHESFSAESKFAAPGAPRWNEADQLVTPGGQIVFDERRRTR